MMQEIKWLLERADESLRAAELMIGHEMFHSAVSEAYYAMFYAAQALLLKKGVQGSTHKGVITQLAVKYVKTGELDQRYGRMLARAFAARGKADYEIGIAIEKAEAEQIEKDATAFLLKAKKVLENG